MYLYVCVCEPSILCCTTMYYSAKYGRVRADAVCLCGATFMRRYDVCLFFARNTFRQRKHIVDIRMASSPLLPRLSNLHMPFSLLESDSFLEIHCAFYRHRVFGEFWNQFDFLFFRFYRSAFSVRIHFAYTHTYIRRIFIFLRIQRARMGDIAISAAQRRSFMTRMKKEKFKRTRREQTEPSRSMRCSCSWYGDGVSGNHHE